LPCNEIPTEEVPLIEFEFSNDPYYLFVDPGLTTGWAVFSPEGKFLHLNQVFGIEEFGELLERIIVERRFLAIVAESYIINPKVKQGGSDVPSAQVIGIMKHLCRKYLIPYDDIEPRHTTVGYRWSGTVQPSNHAVSHGPDARAIGEFWLRRKKIKPMGI
jgi:hypothetical protein